MRRTDARTGERRLCVDTGLGTDGGVTPGNSGNQTS